MRICMVCNTPEDQCLYFDVNIYHDCMQDVCCCCGCELDCVDFTIQDEWFEYDGYNPYIYYDDYYDDFSG